MIALIHPNKLAQRKRSKKLHVSLSMLHPNIFSAVFSAIISVGLLEGFKNTTLKQVYLIKTERFCAKIRFITICWPDHKTECFQ